MLYFMADSFTFFTHIIQGCFTDTGVKETIATAPMMHVLTYPYKLNKGLANIY